MGGSTRPAMFFRVGVDFVQNFFSLGAVAVWQQCNDLAGVGVELGREAQCLEGLFDTVSEEGGLLPWTITSWYGREVGRKFETAVNAFCSLNRCFKKALNHNTTKFSDIGESSVQGPPSGSWLNNVLGNVNTDGQIGGGGIGVL